MSEEEPGRTPYVAGTPAIWGEPVMTGMEDVLSRWRCPHCGAELSRKSRVCLNACGLSVASFREMQSGLREAARRVDAGEVKP